MAAAERGNRGRPPDTDVPSLLVQGSLPWELPRKRTPLLSLVLELTARCNNNCRHCFIGLPATNRVARASELTRGEVKAVIDQAGALGTIWVNFTGGEPLIRDDFLDIYVYLKEKGFLVSVFTNATLITKEHIEVFRKYSPQVVDVSVYGAIPSTYEKITRKPGSFEAFRKGLKMLSAGAIKVGLKTIAMRSNLEEMPEIFRFCQERSRDYFRFDRLLILRHDGDPARNAMIRSERLTPEQIVQLEQADSASYESAKKECIDLFGQEPTSEISDQLFFCGAGDESAWIGANGYFRLCSSLCHPQGMYDLRKGNLFDAWTNFVPRVVSRRSTKAEFLKKCSGCRIKSLCMWCPAYAHLETGELDMWIDYFCRVAHAKKIDMARWIPGFEAY